MPALSTLSADPIDTCFSYFSKLFTGAKTYAHDLGRAGPLLPKLMRGSWNTGAMLIPDGVMLDVQYEEFGRGSGCQARRMIAHCGLEWDDACLEFYKTERPIRTGSAVEVRRPIYVTSVGRWRAYGNLLQRYLKR